MFFTHDRSFEEFFCICIQLLNKTWKEMRATSEDFNKVRLDFVAQLLKYGACNVRIMGSIPAWGH